MSKLRMISAACLLTAMAAPAMADGATGPRIYPYPASANYCPAGLRPITIDGVICCGTPNQTMTYQQAKAAPVVRRSYRSYSAGSCPEGEKGCSFK